MGSVIQIGKAYVAAFTVSKGPLKMRVIVAALWTVLYFGAVCVWDRLDARSAEPSS